MSTISGKRSQGAYAERIKNYQDEVINTLFETNGYLRNPSGNEGRRFQIYLDLLGEPNQAQVRNYRANYFVVITPSSVLWWMKFATPTSPIW